MILHYTGGLWTPEERADGPKEFALEQNYPNPFNPSTVIRYDVKSTGPVTLTVYDLLGRDVTTLVHGTMSVGEHSVTWNAKKVPTGVYFCRMQAGSFVQTRKMMVLK